MKSYVYVSACVVNDIALRSMSLVYLREQTHIVSCLQGLRSPPLICLCQLLLHANRFHTCPVGIRSCFGRWYHFCFRSSPFKRLRRLEIWCYDPSRLIYVQTEDRWRRRRPSPVASHGDTVIRECLSNYDSTQCRPCWWKHTWGTRYMLFIPDNRHFVAQLWLLWVWLQVSKQSCVWHEIKLHLE